MFDPDYTAFNINCHVKVKLTDKGLELLKFQHDKWLLMFKSHGEFVPPKTDEYGYVTYQFWDFMETFGPTIQFGFKPLFETTILLENVSLKTLTEETKELNDGVTG